MVIYPNIVPHPFLQPYIKNYFLLHVNLKGVPTHARSKPIPPDANQSLFFYPRSITKTVVHSTSEKRNNPSSIFVSNQTSRVNIEFGDDHLIIQVCFKPGFLFHLLGRIPIADFEQKEINAEHFSSPELKELNERLRGMTDYLEMIVAIESYLMKRIGAMQFKQRPIDKAIQYLKESKHPVSLDWLAREACLSPRQLERLFKERMGMSPKFFARINRFDNAFRMKARYQQMDWLDIALACGYFDFSHLMRDFKQFAEVTPSMLMAQEMASPDYKKPN